MRFLIFIFLAFLTSCMPLIDIPPKRERIANGVSRSTIKILSKRHGMSPMGVGGGMMYQVNTMFIAFNINRFMTIKEARALIVDCAEEYLEQINSDEELRPFLVNYPFTMSNIEVEVYARSPNNGSVFYPYVGSMGMNNGKIHYYKNDPKERYKLKSEIYETYEEAREILDSAHAYSYKEV